MLGERSHSYPTLSGRFRERQPEYNPSSPTPSLYKETKLGTKLNPSETKTSPYRSKEERSGRNTFALRDVNSCFSFRPLSITATRIPHNLKKKAQHLRSQHIMQIRYGIDGQPTNLPSQMIKPDKALVPSLDIGDDNL